MTKEIVPAESLVQMIFLIRGQKVILDADLAPLYEISTRHLNQAVKRNFKRFPPDFMFRLSVSEKSEVITNCDNLRKLKFSRHLPYAFTEHGVAMLSSVLKSDRAIDMSIYIVRAFIKMRELLASHKDLALKVEELERHQKVQAAHINRIYSIIGHLIEEPVPRKGPIGFTRKQDHDK